MPIFPEVLKPVKTLFVAIALSALILANGGCGSGSGSNVSGQSNPQIASGIKNSPGVSTNESTPNYSTSTSAIEKATSTTTSTTTTTSTGGPVVNGIYYLMGGGSTSVPSSVLSNPNIPGLAVRNDWASVEPSDGTFNWSAIDAAISIAKQYGKKVTINIGAGVSAPSWLYSEGAQKFTFSSGTIPVPWDTIFLNKWGQFVAALGARYGSNPYVAAVKLSGINSTTNETFLPHSSTDTANWKAIGYTRTKVEQAWQKIAADFNAAFPSRPFAAMLVPCGFPPIDNNGNIISGASCDKQVAPDLLTYGINNYGRGRFTGENNGWNSWVWPLLATDSASIDMGYQEAKALGSSFPTDAQTAVNDHAKFLEIYPTDATSSTLQSSIKTINQELMANTTTGGGVTNTTSGGGTTTSGGTLPRPDHIVIVIEENKAYSQIIGSSSAPYINSLAAQGALFSQSYAITHPSQPNYLALFSGSTQGVTTDNCPYSFTDANLGSELLGAGLTFGSYEESMPSVGYTGSSYGNYARKHNPAVNWQGANIPSSSNMPLTSFPSDFSQLPTVSIVVPNLMDDMHNGTISAGDTWLKNNIDPYVQWAKTNNSLLILTWDEDDSTSINQIPTIFVGPMVKAGVYSQHINHYNMLRTVLDMYGLAPLANSSTVTDITGIY